MQSWLAGKLVSFLMARLRAGDIRPTQLLDAPDVELTFPGQSSWSGVFHGKVAVERWRRRFTEVGVQIFPDEVVAKGWPWSSTLCVRGHDYVRGPAGELVYENRYVIWAHMAWGRLKRYEVYEDTHKINDLDAYLLEHRPELATA